MSGSEPRKTCCCGAPLNQKLSIAILCTNQLGEPLHQPHWSLGTPCHNHSLYCGSWLATGVIIWPVAGSTQLGPAAILRPIISHSSSTLECRERWLHHHPSRAASPEGVDWERAIRRPPVDPQGLARRLHPPRHLLPSTPLTNLVSLWVRPIGPGASPDLIAA